MSDRSSRERGASSPRWRRRPTSPSSAAASTTWATTSAASSPDCAKCWINSAKSQIIVGSTREILNVIEWLEAGAPIVTVVPHLLEGMLIHPYSKETVQMFLRDAARAEEMLKGSSA